MAKNGLLFFDKTKINEETCNFFSQTGGARGRTFPKVCVLAVENKDNVWIKKTKQEVLETIKKDPALIGKT